MKQTQVSQTPRAPKTGGIALPKSKRGPKAFFKGVSREIKAINWPTPKAATRLTMTVVYICVLTTGFLWLVGLIFDFIQQSIGAGR